MAALMLHQFHLDRGAHFTEVNGQEVAAHYGDWRQEHEAIWKSAALVDNSARTRLCLTGEDRQRFLNGQVTNEVARLKTFEGSYAALITAKGKMQADLNIYALENELLLDAEPGLTQLITDRLNKYIIADDVNIIDVAPFYGLLTLLGPKAPEAVQKLGLTIPTSPARIAKTDSPVVGEVYVATTDAGIDLFIPAASLESVFEQASEIVTNLGGALAGWEAVETARIESGRPRFGQDMGIINLPPEAGLDKTAISYTKGCYIGQEVIARIRTYGQVAKALRGLLMEKPAAKGAKLFLNEKEIGYLTSSIDSPRFGRAIGLGYVRRESNQPGTKLLLKDVGATQEVEVVTLPFDLPARF